MNYKKPSNWTKEDKDQQAGKQMLHFLHHPEWCAWCDVSGADWICGGCGLASYCSEECQTADWKDRHHILCPLMKQAMADERAARGGGAAAAGAGAGAAGGAGAAAAAAAAAAAGAVAGAGAGSSSGTVSGSVSSPGTGASSPLSVANNSEGGEKPPKRFKANTAPNYGNTRNTRKTRQSRKNRKTRQSRRT